MQKDCSYLFDLFITVKSFLLRLTKSIIELIDSFVDQFEEFGIASFVL